MTADPRILTPEQLVAIRAAAPNTLLALGVDALFRHIEALTEQAALDRPVIAAAEELIRLKSRATAAFPGGLESMPGLVRTSGPHAVLARRLIDAGEALERAVSDRKGRSS